MDNSEKPCPSCGYCPTCRRPQWPANVSPYGVPAGPYWEWPYRPIWVYPPPVTWGTTVTTTSGNITIKQD